MSFIHRIESGISVGKYVVVGTVGQRIDQGYKTEVDIQTYVDNGSPVTSGTAVEVISPDEVQTFPFQDYIHFEISRFKGSKINHSSAKGVLRYLGDLQQPVEDTLILFDMPVEEVRIPRIYKLTGGLLKAVLTNKTTLTAVGMGIAGRALAKDHMSLITGAFVGLTVGKLLTKKG
jgi:hypothetical protein